LLFSGMGKKGGNEGGWRKKTRRSSELWLKKAEQSACSEIGWIRVQKASPGRVRVTHNLFFGRGEKCRRKQKYHRSSRSCSVSEWVPDVRFADENSELGLCELGFFSHWTEGLWISIAFGKPGLRSRVFRFWIWKIQNLFFFERTTSLMLLAHNHQSYYFLGIT
jgi:hypothetical protein